MSLFLTDEQKALKETVRRFTEKEIIPVRAELDEREEYPEGIIHKLISDLGMNCPFIPEEYGGIGQGIFESALIAEELSRGCLGVSTAFSVTGLGFYPVLIGGSDEMKRRILPAAARGEKKSAFALTEAGAGSDITAIRTTAVKKGDRYVINGVKQWITGASRADLYTVFALTDKNRGIRGMSCLIVENETSGMSFGAKERKLGIRCSETREVIFEDCEVPLQNLVGKEGHGFKYVMETLHHSRAVVAASAVGIAQGAFECALQYATVREQFGNPISSLQSIQHLLAEMSTRIESGRLLAYTAARMIDDKNPRHRKFSAMAKYYCAENALWVANTAIQILGGYGYMRDYPVEKMLRDARILSIYEGTSQIQMNEIAHELIREVKRG